MSGDRESTNAQGNMESTSDNGQVLYGEATTNAKDRKLFFDV